MANPQINFYYFLLSRQLRHSRVDTGRPEYGPPRIHYSQTLLNDISKTQRAGPSGITYGDRTGNKPQNTPSRSSMRGLFRARQPSRLWVTADQHAQLGASAAG